ncbi:MAG: DUF3309 family protein [Gallionellaceae bacterium]
MRLCAAQHRNMLCKHLGFSIVEPCPEDSSGNAKWSKANWHGSLILILLALAGMNPIWPHSSEWGYGPSGGIGLILLIVLILFLLGKIQVLFCRPRDQMRRV